MLLKDKSKFVVGLDWTTEIRITPDIIEDSFDNYMEPLYITKKTDGAGDEMGMVSGKDVSGKSYCFAYYIQTLINKSSFTYVHRLDTNEYYYLQVSDGVVEPTSDKIMDASDALMVIKTIDLEKFPLYVNPDAEDELVSNDESVAFNPTVIDVNIFAKPPKSTLLISNESKLEALKAHRPLLLILIGFGVFLYFYLTDEEIEDVPVLADIKAEEAAKIRKQQEDFIEAKIREHSSSPLPSAQVNGCLEASLEIPVSLGGWLGDVINCLSDRAVKSYTRQPNTAHTDIFLDLTSEYGLNGKVSYGKNGLPVGTVSSQPFKVENRQPIGLSDLPYRSQLKTHLNDKFFPLFDSSCSFHEVIGYFNSPNEKPLDSDLNIAQVDYSVICTSLSFFHERFDLAHLDEPYVKFMKYSINPKNSTLTFKYLAR